eukprot:CAMPEP_0202454158 /NCGR_PEP_ID=MMETSP1360-20130828/11972_1 /ASSEMBLY_ACC=CAM_ASM_000848 /TAXON_ID=515479 /ORGANISM="Licmophora paradoxa, Strain CCMP2313" /LENGTH=654 /DNA_ID=CAMNT_0049073415 /DNA_START=84 /DNA_END=2048 /DNA_ORIENTATION=+
MLQQRESLLEQVLKGTNGPSIKFPPIRFTDQWVQQAAKIRMERDGIWIVGQEESWQEERQEWMEQQRIQSIQQYDTRKKAKQQRSVVGWKSMVQLCSKNPAANQNRANFRNNNDGLYPQTNHHQGFCEIDDALESDSQHNPQPPPLPNNNNVVVEIIGMRQVNTQGKGDHHNPNDKNSADTQSSASSSVEGKIARNRRRLIRYRSPKGSTPRAVAKRQRQQSETAIQQQSKNHHIDKKQQSEDRNNKKRKAPSKKFTPTRSMCFNKTKIDALSAISVGQYKDVMDRIKSNRIKLDRDFDMIRRRGEKFYDFEIKGIESMAHHWEALLKKILGPEITTAQVGVYYVEPGAPAQQTFAPLSPHLSLEWQRPCHAVQVLIPLVDLKGTYQLLLGSHILFRDDPSNSENSKEAPFISAGTPIFVDSRIGQRGLGNSTKEPIMIWYFTFVATPFLEAFQKSLGDTDYEKLEEFIQKKTTMDEERKSKREKEKRNRKTKNKGRQKKGDIEASRLAGANEKTIIPGKNASPRLGQSPNGMMMMPNDGNTTRVSQNQIIDLVDDNTRSYAATNNEKEIRKKASSSSPTESIQRSASVIPETRLLTQGGTRNANLDFMGRQLLNDAPQPKSAQNRASPYEGNMDHEEVAGALVALRAKRTVHA